LKLVTTKPAAFALTVPPARVVTRPSAPPTLTVAVLLTMPTFTPAAFALTVPALAVLTLEPVAVLLRVTVPPLTVVTCAFAPARLTSAVPLTVPTLTSAAAALTVPALAAFVAASEWLQERGVAATGAACRELAAECAARLRVQQGVRVFAAEGAPIVSFTVEHYAPTDVAAMVEAAAGLQVRAGFHCAAAVHEHLGTRAGGTVRASFGPFNTDADVEALAAAVAEIVG